MDKGQSKRTKDIDYEDSSTSSKRTKNPLPKIQKSIDDLTEKYKKRTKFLVSPNPVSKAEAQEFYTGLNPNKTYFMSLEDKPLKPIFEDELEEILGEDYEKYALNIFENVDKTSTGVYFFVNYLQNELNIKNFGSTININPMNIILDFIHYFYLRLGDPSQYYGNNYYKLVILLNLIWAESADSKDLDIYTIKINNPKKESDETLSLTLSENGVLTKRDENDEVEDQLLSKYENFEIEIPDKDDYDINRFPSQPELLPFHFKSFRSIYNTFFNLGNFIISLITNFIKESEYMYYKPNELKLPIDFNFHLLESLREYEEDIINRVKLESIVRYYVVPLSLPQHHNLLIFDHKFQTIERFEPHGSLSNTIIKNILKKNENKIFLMKDGFSGILQDLEKEQYLFSKFFQDERLITLLVYLQEYYKNNKAYQNSFHSIFMDIELSRLKQLIPSEFQTYRIMYPSDYEIEIGPQTYYDNRLEDQFPMGMCVTFCYLYLALRTQVVTQQDFEVLQKEINEKYFDFLLEWYKKNINSQVVVEQSEKKNFVSQAVVEFILYVNNIYLKNFLEEINSLFDINLKDVGGRHINL